MLAQIPNSKGIYVLLLEATQPTLIMVGALGPLNLNRGFYVYVGSARGSGGLRGRLGRYLRGPKSLRWHIDYVLMNNKVKLRGIVLGETQENLERAVALKLIEMGFNVIKEGVGASEYRGIMRSYSHLLRSPKDDLCGSLKLVERAFLSLSLRPKLIKLGGPPSTPHGH